LKLALFTASKLNAPWRTCCGPVGAAGSELGVAGLAGCWVTEAALSLDALRALLTAKTVAPSSATPRRARRKGREIAIAWHIGRRRPLV
jgi:hypothetical protein